MASTTFANLSALHKVQYPFGLQALFFKACVLYGLMPKVDNFVGEAIVVPVKSGRGRKVAVGFTNAQTNTSNSVRARFLLETSFPLYGDVRIEGRAIRRCKDAGTLKNIVTDEMDSALGGMAQRLGQLCYGNGGGSLGVIAENADPIIRMEDPDSLMTLEEGDVIRPSLTDGTSGAVIANPRTIQELNRITGEITLDAAAVADYAVGNRIFFEDTFGAVMTGVGGYIPATDAAAATTFRSLDRAPDLVKYAGTRLVASANDGTIGRAITRLVNTCGKFCDGPTDFTVMLGSRAFLQLVLEEQDKTVVQKFAKNSDGTESKVGYRGIEVICGKHRATVFEDSINDPNIAWNLDLDTFKIHAVPGGFPGLIDEDGSKMLRRHDEDAFEWRYIAEGDMSCKAPVRNGRMDLSAILEAAPEAA